MKNKVIVFLTLGCFLIANSADKIDPPKPEKTSPSIKSQSTPLTRVPDPAGIKVPLNEKPKTTVELAETIKPLAAASPPLAPEAHPS